MVLGSSPIVSVPSVTLMKFVCFAFVLSLLVFNVVQAKDNSRELATLTAKFHSLITELGKDGSHSNAYEKEAASLLKRLEQFQYNGATRQNISIDWFSGTFVQADSMRIILVVSSFEGMYLNSGIGTFYAALSDFLVNHGHAVTILYTRTDSADTSSNSFEKWQKSYSKRGVSIVKLDPLSVHVTSPSLTQKSYQVYQYLKNHQEEFDVVHFPDWEGPGYFSVVAKHQRLAFSSKTFIVGLHGPWRWVKHGNQLHGLSEEQDFETDWLERKSVELADFVITPSADLPRWLASQGWSIPEDEGTSTSKLSLMPFLPGRDLQMIKSNKNSQKKKAQELVFFGRLETRKGVLLYADALDLISQRRPETNLKVSFLGRNTEIENQTSTKYLASRAEKGNWPFKVEYLTHRDRKSALEYLKQAGQNRVAVIPSLADNAPYTIYECLYARIPFVASNIPSISALINPEDRHATLFETTAEAIANKLEQIIDEGANVARAQISADDAVKTWEAFYNMIYSHVQESSEQTALDLATKPVVSVCITYFNRPEFLPMALQSIQEQDYPLSKIEVVLVDDGSTNTDAIDYIDNLRPLFEKNNWQIIRTENKYLGAARNTAAGYARGDYILFLDDDNLAMPNQISTYVSVAQVTGADLLTAAHDVFRGYGLPRPFHPDKNVVSRSVPLGSAVALGVFKNCFGDANFFIKRGVYGQTGGFTEERNVGQEDYEFLAKAVLSGLHLEAIPEPLLYYRQHNQTNQMMYQTDTVENIVRAGRVYKPIMDETGESEDTLMLLARKTLRSLNNTLTGFMCNMTVLKVIPDTIKTLQNVTLTFNATNIDCLITHVFIGSYLCTNIKQFPENGTFTCVTVALPFPGTYSLSVRYLEFGDEVDRLTPRLVAEKDTSGKTSATLMLKFIADLSLYTREKLWALFSRLGGIELIDLVLIDDIIPDPAQAKRSFEEMLATGFERHDMRFAVVSRNPNDPAPAVARRLIQTSMANKPEFKKIGVEFLDFNIISQCDDKGVCVCTPSFSGDTCTEDAYCPNNCTSPNHGTCVLGPYNRVCECKPGWAGRNCSIKTCENDCSGHGACRLTGTASNPTAQCICDKGWTGSLCETVAPCPNNCGGHGTCVQGVCKCAAGWSGDDCRAESNIGREESNDDETDAVTIGMSIAVAITGLGIITAIALFVYLRRLRQ